MLSGTESLRRRRVHSEDALDSVRLKNSRSGYLSRVTTLCRAAEVLLNDSKNVNEVSKKLLEIEEAVLSSCTCSQEPLQRTKQYTTANQ